ncbi:MAG: hypothetical protein LUG99_12040 [Lachnospiraceae bacterium]|nr:hypothetical protein [Lachnospiraceae bacterium]
MIDNEKSLKLEENHEPLVVYTQKDLLRIFPFKRTKLQQLLNAGALPVVKVGRTYLSSDEMISRWLLENAGRTIYY